jgi:hypothetical protein
VVDWLGVVPPETEETAENPDERAVVELWLVVAAAEATAVPARELLSWRPTPPARTVTPSRVAAVQLLALLIARAPLPIVVPSSPREPGAPRCLMGSR